MRKQFEIILKDHFRTAVIRFRQANGLTQDQMAQRLGISLRCYCDLESGKSCPSAVTLMMFLQMCEDSRVFTEELRQAFDAEKSAV